MKREKIENKLLAVVRIRGRVNVRQSIAETLNRLNLKRVNNLVIVFGTKSNIGMLNKCENYVTYGEVDESTLKRMLSEKGVNIDETKIPLLMKGEVSAKSLGISMPIRMKPPRRGYKNIKLGYSAGGDLGYRGAKINDLIKRML